MVSVRCSNVALEGEAFSCSMMCEKCVGDRLGVWEHWKM